MKTLFENVADFNAKFDLPVAKAAFVNEPWVANLRRKPQLLDPGDYEYRLRFIQEELSEFTTAHGASDLCKAADAIVDLAYVVLGTAHYMGLPFDDIWNEVHRTNMLKKRPPVAADEHSRGPREHLRKPEGWKGPDIRGILIDAGWRP